MINQCMPFLSSGGFLQLYMLHNIGQVHCKSRAVRESWLL